jgi:hypothetical protein
MKNHGSTVVGESIEVATLYAIFLEKAARIQLMATASAIRPGPAMPKPRIKYEQIYTPHRLDRCGSISSAALKSFASQTNRQFTATKDTRFFSFVQVDINNVVTLSEAKSPRVHVVA